VHRRRHGRRRPVRSPLTPAGGPVTPDLDPFVAKPLGKTHGARRAKQGRSERTRGAIIDAVIAVLADVGVAGLTHRLVAQRSGASLAATTYYFESKQEMIAEACEALLRTHLADLARLAEAESGVGAAAFRRFVARVVANGVGEQRPRTLAWCEIVLDAARHPQAYGLTRSWYERLVRVWSQIARAYEAPYPAIAARFGTDITLGALFHGLGLGLSPETLSATLGGRVAAADLFPPAAAQPAVSAKPSLSAKAWATRERILEAAIGLLAARGAAAVNYRSVALEAGLTPGAPAYYFSSSKALLGEAQVLLFSRSKARYREVMSSAFNGLDMAMMVELTAVIFQSEATEFGPLNLAAYAIWLQAAREPELRPLVQEALADLYRAWSRILLTVGAVNNGAEPLLVQYLFVGAQIWAMTAGVTPGDLVNIRWRLRDDLTALAQGRHWIQSD
jgi:DNA-binding transcriptional regulator YbjK